MESSPSSPWMSSISFSVGSPCCDSPFSLFKSAENKQGYKGNYISKSVREDIFNTPKNQQNVLTPVNSKQARPIHDFRRKVLVPKNSDNVKLAVQKSVQDPELIGDFSKHCLLPCIKGKHEDLKTISPQTIADVVKGKYGTETFTIVDCRYPYEYEGGHIVGAKNIYTKESILKEFLHNQRMLKRNGVRNIIIFHCEFSSERGPNLYRFLRQNDRDMNQDIYPFLYFPEMYLLEGGYKSFYDNFKDLCEPQEYRTMLDENHGHDLQTFRAKCKSWIDPKRSKVCARAGLKF